MFVRFLWTVLLLVTLGNTGRCQCLDTFFLPNPIQQEGERTFEVRELHLLNVIHATVDEQEKIAAALAGIHFCVSGKASSGTPREGVPRLRAQDKQDELTTHIRMAFQRFGYFKVTVLLLTFEDQDTSVDPPTVVVTARVDDGPRYTLNKITFTGDKAITNTAVLRDSFPIKDGDIFDTSKIREGMDNLRRLYDEFGHINFTPVPDTKIDEKNKLITLNLDLDEGGVFVVKSFAIEGADAQRKAALTALWPEMLQPGKVYNTRLVEWFLQQARGQKLLPPDTDEDDPYLSRHLDEASHTVDIVLRFPGK